MSGDAIREVRYSERILHELSRELGDDETVVDFMAGVEFLLAIAPERGIRVAKDPDVWMMPGAAFASAFAVFYAFDDKKVSLLSIRGKSSAVEEAE